MSPREVRALSFDADGTLWDFRKVMRHSLALALYELRREVGKAAAGLTVDALIETRDRVAAMSGPDRVLEDVRREAFGQTLLEIGAPDDELAERMRFIGHSRGARMKPHFGRLHTERGYAYRMPACAAAITLGQMEIIDEQVEHIDKMVRYLTQLLGEIPGIIPLAIPDYVTTYSAWMTGFSIDPAAFRVDAEDFASQVAEGGIPGAGLGKYYLMPAACTFLHELSANKEYPFSMPPASREYRYSGDHCPTAQDFLATFIRWSSICAKYQPEHCELAADIVRTVADRNRG